MYDLDEERDDLVERVKEIKRKLDEVERGESVTLKWEEVNDLRAFVGEFLMAF